MKNTKKDYTQIYWMIVSGLIIGSLLNIGFKLNEIIELLKSVR